MLLSVSRGIIDHQTSNVILFIRSESHHLSNVWEYPVKLCMRFSFKDTHIYIYMNLYARYCIFRYKCSSDSINLRDSINLCDSIILYDSLNSFDPLNLYDSMNLCDSINLYDLVDFCDSYEFLWFYKFLWSNKSYTFPWSYKFLWFYIFMGSHKLFSHICIYFLFLKYLQNKANMSIFEFWNVFFFLFVSFSDFFLAMNRFYGFYCKMQRHQFFAELLVFKLKVRGL